MKPIRIFMNCYDDAVLFLDNIYPLCSHINKPDADDWIYFDKPIKLTIKWRGEPTCMEIYKNRGYKNDRTKCNET